MADALARDSIGVCDNVVATLEREGIGKFVASFDELLEWVADKRRHLAAAA